MEFHTWYLKEKGWIQHTDTGGYTITASGEDIVEENKLILGKERLITYNDGLLKNTKDLEDSDNNRKAYPRSGRCRSATGKRRSINLSSCSGTGYQYEYQLHI